MSSRSDQWRCWRYAAHPVAAHPQFRWPQCAVCAAAPDYPKRMEFAQGVALEVFVPSSGSALSSSLAPRSAIVGVSEPEQDRVLVCFEGWVYGQYDKADPWDAWGAGLAVALDRLVTGYPTVAKRFCRRQDLVRVGSIVVGQALSFDEGGLAALERWLGCPPPSR